MNDKSLIVALDWMSKECAHFTMEELLKKDKLRKWVKSNLNSTEWVKWDVIFKLNDLLIDLGFAWIKQLVFELWNNWYDTNKISFMFDPKWSDIPNTIENYFTKLHNSGIQNVRFVTIKADWWFDMMRRAVDIKKKYNMSTKILAITTLTSLDDNACNNMFWINARHSTLKLAKMALEAWVDGLVCSPKEASMIRYVFEWYDFEIVTPWIRLKDTKVKWDDQKRFDTPDSAIVAWSNHLVVWRPITESKKPIDVVNSIIEAINWVSYDKNLNEKEFGKLFHLERLLYNEKYFDIEKILKYIWAIYIRPKWWKYVRLASKLLSNWYLNVWIVERNPLLLDVFGKMIANKINLLNIKSDIVSGAQMWSVRLSTFISKYLWHDLSIYSEKSWEDLKDMDFLRHDVDMEGKNIILSEDVITWWTTIEKMIKKINKKWWNVVWVCCLINRFWSDNYNGIPLISLYKPNPFDMYHDETTPLDKRGSSNQLTQWSLIAEKPKNQWNELVESMK